MSLPDLDKDFIFRGLDSEECEDFVFWVIRRARDQGKMEDDQWIARLAMACMAKGALRWYIQLEPDVQDSWRLLRRALMERYPEPDERHAQPRNTPLANPTVPNPAAAPPTSPLYITPARPTAITGYIKLACEEAAHSGYLSGKYHHSYGLKITQNKTDAIKISFKPETNGRFTPVSMSSQYTQLELMRSGHSSCFCFLVLLDESSGGVKCEVTLDQQIRLKALWYLSIGSPRTITVMVDDGTKPTKVALVLQRTTGLLEWVLDLNSFRGTGWTANQYPLCDMQFEAVD